MLPGNLQYWQPCKYQSYEFEYKGTIGYNINEPIHFSGPSPGDQSAIAEEEEKQPETLPLDQTPVFDQDDPLGAAQQRNPEETNITTPVQRPIQEEVKEPEPTKGAVTSALSEDAPPRVIQQPIQTV